MSPLSSGIGGLPPHASSSSSSGSNSGTPWYRDIRRYLAENPPSSLWSQSNEESLLEPYTYLASRPGKEIRSKLIDAFNYWLQVPDEHLSRVRKVVDMLHTASLLMDDVEDNSDLRRGLPVAHRVYGTPQVLNSANYVYFLVFRQVEAMGQGVDEETSRKATLSERLLVAEMINLHRGQGLDLLWRDTLTCPTEEEYAEMVRNKTGGLLRIAGGLMRIWSPVYDASRQESSTSQQQQQPDLLPLLDLIGLLFQIRDDYMNLSADSYAQNKGFAEDLTEGKFSFPMIHGIRCSAFATEGHTSAAASSSSAATSAVSAPFPHPVIPRTALDSPVLRGSTPLPGSGSAPTRTAASLPPNRQLLSILSSKPTDEHIKRYAISYLKDVTGSFAYCRKVMRELDEQIWEELVRVEEMFGGAEGKNEQLRKILLALRQGWWEDTE